MIQQFTTKIKTFVADNALEQAISELMNFMHDYPQQNQVIIQSARYHSIEKKLRDNTVSQTEADIEKNRIRVAILQIVDNLDEYVTNSNMQQDNRLRYKLPPKPEFFVGREQKLEEIHQRLTKNDSPLQVFLLTGVGGMGKTTLMQQYIYSAHCQKHFQNIVFTSAFSGLESSFLGSMAAALRIDLKEYTRSEDQRRVITYYMKQSEGNNLMVIDNANNKDELDACKALFVETNWKFLITTRAEPDKFKNSTIRVDELSITEAKQLFTYYYTDQITQPDLLIALLQHIFCHTLLIELLAKVGDKRGLQLEHLLEMLKEQDRLILSLAELKGKANDENAHSEFTRLDPNVTIKNYILSLFEPEKLGEEYVTMVRFFSVLPPSDMPIHHLKELWQVSADAEDIFEYQLDYLKQWGWLTGKKLRQANYKTQTLAYKMHPLVQEVVYDKLPPNINNVRPLVKTISKILIQPLSQSSEYQKYAQFVIDKLDFLNDLLS